MTLNALDENTLPLSSAAVACESEASVAERSIRLFNVKYSPNLGDGVLSECLEEALAQELGSADVASIDLAGREAYGGSGTGRHLALSVLNILPQPVRRAAIRLPLVLQSRRKWRPHYRTGVKPCDAVVIGGGNLLADLDLNFPTKLALALDEAARRDLPVAFYGVGCAARWSDTGRHMLARVLARTDLKAVFVRDDASRINWNRLFGHALHVPAELVRDPGLLASETYRAARPISVGRRVGLGIMSDTAVRYHSDVVLRPGELADWYVAVASALCQDGASVVAFTNGSPEDKAMLAAIAERLEAAAPSVTFAEPRTPAELCETIAGLDRLIAFRMHAIIVAYSYGVPALALRWDPKLDAFMASVGLSEQVVAIGEAAPAGIPRRLDAAAAVFPSERRRERILAETRAGIGRLAAALEV